MWEQIVNLAVSQGIFAALFCFLLYYLIRESRSREAKYQDIIKTLNARLSVVEGIKDDVAVIKGAVVKKPRQKNGEDETTAGSA